ncbi:hypothetical protein, variant [Capsaspora owczarzaki ATCC 30864]|nr:hypothetical protein, variant [Capsaspora owczarzaki ATCC 30864]
MNSNGDHHNAAAPSDDNDGDLAAAAAAMMLGSSEQDHDLADAETSHTVDIMRQSHTGTLGRATKVANASLRGASAASSRVNIVNVFVKRVSDTTGLPKVSGETAIPEIQTAADILDDEARAALTTLSELAEQAEAAELEEERFDPLPETLSFSSASSVATSRSVASDAVGAPSTAAANAAATSTAAHTPATTAVSTAHASSAASRALKFGRSLFSDSATPTSPPSASEAESTLFHQKLEVLLERSQNALQVCRKKAAGNPRLTLQLMRMDPALESALHASSLQVSASSSSTTSTLPPSASAGSASAAPSHRKTDDDEDDDDDDEPAPSAAHTQASNGADGLHTRSAASAAAAALQASERDAAFVAATHLAESVDLAGGIVVTALCSYDAQDESELPFEKGDVLYVLPNFPNEPLRSQQAWWRCRKIPGISSMGPRDQGFVPACLVNSNQSAVQRIQGLYGQKVYTETAREEVTVNKKGKLQHDVPAASHIHPTFCGYLSKLGGSGLRKNWRRRWFVLTNCCLFYYKSPEDQFALGKIAMPGYTVAYAADRRHSFRAEYGAGRRTYHFQADSREEMQLWMYAMGLATLLDDLPDQTKELLSERRKQRAASVAPENAEHAETTGRSAASKIAKFVRKPAFGKSSSPASSFNAEDESRQIMELLGDAVPVSLKEGSLHVGRAHSGSVLSAHSLDRHGSMTSDAHSDASIPSSPTAHDEDRSQHWSPLSSSPPDATAGSARSDDAAPPAKPPRSSHPRPIPQSSLTSTSPGSSSPPTGSIASSSSFARPSGSPRKPPPPLRGRDEISNLLDSIDSSVERRDPLGPPAAHQRHSSSASHSSRTPSGSGSFTSTTGGGPPPVSVARLFLGNLPENRPASPETSHSPHSSTGLRSPRACISPAPHEDSEHESDSTTYAEVRALQKPSRAAPLNSGPSTRPSLASIASEREVLYAAVDQQF